ncbi:hypothetical protein [Pasteurella testudinis]|uniref:hypothetical protein n=1 Tax=Pasteurella testudinis TaxID=761 RepID=UPI0040582C26
MQLTLGYRAHNELLATFQRKGLPKNRHSEHLSALLVAATHHWQAQLNQNKTPNLFVYDVSENNRYFLVFHYIRHPHKADCWILDR